VGRQPELLEKTLRASAVANDRDETVLEAAPSASAPRASRDQAALQAALAGRYRVERELGAGGMGRVLLATDLALERPVALKTILPEVLADPHWIERFRLEATVVAGLQHPGIVQVYEILAIEGTPVLVMEYVPGSELREAVDDHRFADRDLAQVMAEVCDAIGFAHSHGVIHRDIKPGNILLTADGTPKVADFGLATDRSRRRSAALERAEEGSILGSPGYLAPEQALGDARRIDSRCDVYGLGATLYYGLTGRPPFRASSFTDVVEQVVNGELAAPSRLRPGVDRDLEAICLKAMSRDPDDRYASASEMARDLRNAIRGLRVSARRYGPWETLVRAVASNREPFLLGVLTVVLMLAGIAGSVLMLHGTAKSSLFEELRRHVTDLAATAALMIDPAWVRAAAAPAAVAGPEAKRLTALLSKIDEQNPDIRYVWVMRRSSRGPSTMEFVALSVPSPAPGELGGDGGISQATATARPGDLFDASPFPELLLGFEGPTADRNYELTDEWGVALSGYAPVADETGRAIAVLGVDVVRTELDDRFAALDRSLAVSLALSGALSIVALLLITATVVGRWRQMDAASLRERAPRHGWR
jgi:serine/threonine protein kinase